jgi:protein-disulfide isomerase/beta-lactamase regulating signal transducer with metallopeptidase domain
MRMPLWFYDLAVYCLQLAVLISVGGLMVAATGLRRPRLRLVYLQLLLALGLLFPAIEHWRALPQEQQSMMLASESIFQAGGLRIESPVTGAASAVPLLSIYDLLALLLVAGLLGRLLWVGVGFMRLRRSWRHSRPLRQHAALVEAKARLGICPAVVICDQVYSPTAFGWRKPRVFLPAKFMQMHGARQRVILYHEFLHVKRRDWLWHFTEEILRALFWFHPAVIWVIGQIRLSREQAVDSEVVALAGSRRDYLDALFEIAAAAPGYTPAPLFLSEHHLKRRVALILKEVVMSRNKVIFALSASFGAALLAGVLAAGVLPFRVSAAGPTRSVKPPLAEPDTHFYGNPDATITVVEFGDFQCPACGKAEAAAEQVRQELGHQVRFAYRQFPLTKFHAEAEKAAEATECAAQQGKFWPAVNYFYAHQSDLSVPALERYAGQLGLDQNRFDRCLSSGDTAARVQQDVRDARAAGVRSVPTFFIGHKMVVGVLSYDRLRALIEEQLSGSKDARTTPAPALAGLKSSLP